MVLEAPQQENKGDVKILEEDMIKDKSIIVYCYAKEEEQNKIVFNQLAKAYADISDFRVIFVYELDIHRLSWDSTN